MLRLCIPIVLTLTLVLQLSSARAQDLTAWKDILSFRPSTSVQKEVLARGKTWTVHRIEDASGRLNLDYYPITVTKLPSVDGKQLTAVELLEYVRLNLNMFVDTSLSEFEPFESLDATKWKSNDANSAIMLIKIKLIPGVTDLALVVTSQDSSNEWRFSTVRGGSGYTALNDRNNPGAHPVTGNRAFGFYRNGNSGGWTFYTIGADRATRSMDEFFGVPGASDIGFKEGDKLWRSFQTKLVTFVTTNGGEATVNLEKTVSKRHDWDSIKSDTSIFTTKDQPDWVPIPR